MADRYTTGGFGGVQTYFGVERDESGHAVHYRGHRQEMSPVFKHVEQLREKVNQASSRSNPNQWHHIGSVPWPILLDWLRDNQYRIDQFARSKEIKDEFLTYFISRDFSKFHNEHVTTKSSSKSQIVVPYSMRMENDRNRRLRDAEGGSTGVPVQQEGSDEPDTKLHLPIRTENLPEVALSSE